MVMPKKISVVSDGDSNDGQVLVVLHVMVRSVAVRSMARSLVVMRWMVVVVVL